VHPQVAVGEPLDRPDRGVEHRNATAEHVVLERLEVARPDADQRAGIDRQRGRRWRREHDLARPRQQA
jgi:hypothetical protein